MLYLMCCPFASKFPVSNLCHLFPLSLGKCFWASLCSKQQVHYMRRQVYDLIYNPLVIKFQFLPSTHFQKKSLVAIAGILEN